MSEAASLGPLGQGAGIFQRARAAHTVGKEPRCESPRMSDDGSVVVYSALNPETGKREVYLRDEQGDAAILSRPASGASDGHSSDPQVSADGRFVVFASAANNLVQGTPEDGFGWDTRVYLYDRASATLECLTLPLLKYRSCDSATISQDGATIAFRGLWSRPDEVGLEGDLLVYDRESHQVRQVELNSKDCFPPYGVGLSRDGSFLVYQHDGIHRRQLASGETVKLGDSGLARSLSPGREGTRLTCSSRSAALLAPGSEAGVLVCDQGGVPRQISLDETGEPLRFAWAPSMSANGRFVAFLANDGKTQSVYRADLETGATCKVHESSAPFDPFEVREYGDDRGPAPDRTASLEYRPALSPDGRVIAYVDTDTGQVETREIVSLEEELCSGRAASVGRTADRVLVGGVVVRQRARSS